MKLYPQTIKGISTENCIKTLLWTDTGSKIDRHWTLKTKQTDSRTVEIWAVHDRKKTMVRATKEPEVFKALRIRVSEGKEGLVLKPRYGYGYGTGAFAADSLLFVTALWLIWLVCTVCAVLMNKGVIHDRGMYDVAYAVSLVIPIPAVFLTIRSVRANKLDKSRLTVILKAVKSKLGTDFSRKKTDIT